MIVGNVEMYDWLVQHIITTAALALVVAFVCYRFRPRPAIEHSLWLLILVKMLVPPFIAWPCLPGAVTEPSEPVAVVSSPKDQQINNGSSYARQSVSRQRKPLSGDHGYEDKCDVEFLTDTPDSLQFENVSSGPIRVRQSSADAELISESHLAGAAGDKADIQERAASLNFASWAPNVGRNWRWWLVALWIAGTVLMVGLQIWRLIRFRRFVRSGREVPDWIRLQLSDLARRLRVRPPRAVLIDELTGPMLWCAGRPRLLWPAAMADRELAGEVTGIVAHELAHLRRRDHWVIQMEMVAACIWWWNPVFWFVRHRLHQAAEMACDAWVVWALPEQRDAYADALVRITRLVSRRAIVAPAWGATGNSRRSFERRLVMIFQDGVSRKLSWFAATWIVLAAVIVLPGWSQSQSVADKPADDSSAKADEVAQEALVAEPTATVEKPATAKPEKRKPASGEAVPNSTARPKPTDGVVAEPASDRVPPIATAPLDGAFSAGSSSTEPPSLRSPSTPSLSPSSPLPVRAQRKYVNRLLGVLPLPLPPEQPQPNRSLVGEGQAAAPVPAQPKVIRTIQLENRDALAMLQLLGTMFDSGSQGWQKTRVIAFVSATPGYRYGPSYSPSAGVPVAGRRAKSTASPVPTSGLYSQNVPGRPASRPSYAPSTTSTTSSPRKQSVLTSSGFSIGSTSGSGFSIGSTPGSVPCWQFRPSDGASSSGGFDVTGMLRMAVDAPSNSLILRGQERMVEFVEKFLEDLDQSDFKMFSEDDSEDLPVQVLLTSERSPRSICAVLRGLGIDVSIQAVPPSKEATPRHGMFLVSSTTSLETMEIGKLIQSLDAATVDDTNQVLPPIPVQPSIAPPIATPRFR